MVQNQSLSIQKEGEMTNATDHIEISQEPIVKSQSSFVTIFSIWNTMMGASVLIMPWALKQAGYINGILLLLLTATIMAYTAYRVLNAGKLLGGDELSEFSAVVRVYMGRGFEVMTVLSSLTLLLTVCVVIWILISNFLYTIGMFARDLIEGDTYNKTYLNDSQKFLDAFCDDNSTSVIQSEHDSGLFTKLWNETNTVPLIVIFLLFPLINFKSVIFFTKFTVLGSICVAYLAIFTVMKATSWGIHVEFGLNHKAEDNYVSNFEWSFPALTGLSVLAYMIHPVLINIMRNQRNPENNTRDLIIAYACVCFTDTSIGALFYAAFPLSKQCIEDNFLKNIAADDIMAFIARVVYLIQLISIYPLVAYSIRSQLYQFLLHTSWPSIFHVLGLNCFIVGICVTLAIVFPQIGPIASFLGALSGFCYAIALPCAVYMFACRKEGTLTVFKFTFHSLLILLGFINLVSQFLIVS